MHRLMAGAWEAEVVAAAARAVAAAQAVAVAEAAAVAIAVAGAGALLEAEALEGVKGEGNAMPAELEMLVATTAELRATPDEAPPPGSSCWPAPALMSGRGNRLPAAAELLCMRRGRLREQPQRVQLRLAAATLVGASSDQVVHRAPGRPCPRPTLLAVRTHRRSPSPRPP